MRRLLVDAETALAVPRGGRGRLTSRLRASGAYALLGVPTLPVDVRVVYGAIVHPRSACVRAGLSLAALPAGHGRGHDMGHVTQPMQRRAVGTLVPACAEAGTR